MMNESETDVIDVSNWSVNERFDESTQSTLIDIAPQPDEAKLLSVDSSTSAIVTSKSSDLLEREILHELTDDTVVANESTITISEPHHANHSLHSHNVSIAISPESESKSPVSVSPISLDEVEIANGMGHKPLEINVSLPPVPTHLVKKSHVLPPPVPKSILSHKGWSYQICDSGRSVIIRLLYDGVSIHLNLDHTTAQVIAQSTFITLEEKGDSYLRRITSNKEEQEIVISGNEKIHFGILPTPTSDSILRLIARAQSIVVGSSALEFNVTTGVSPLLGFCELSYRSEFHIVSPVIIATQKPLLEKTLPVDQEVYCRSENLIAYESTIQLEIIDYTSNLILTESLTEPVVKLSGKGKYWLEC